MAKTERFEKVYGQGVFNGNEIWVDTETGVRAMVAAIEAGKSNARVPAWPWVPLGWAMHNLPLRVVRKLI